MNHVNEVMIKDPILCNHETKIAEIKYLMQKYHYDVMFIVDSDESRRPIGVVYEDDLEAKTVEECPTANSMEEEGSVADLCMKHIPAMVNEFSTIDECLKVMDENHMDRIPVVDGSGHCCGIVDKHEILKKVPHSW